jgi:Flp pilus assembly protein TadD
MSELHNDDIDVPTRRVFFLLWILVFLIYSNTLHAEWHFDDYQNILENQNIRIPDLSYQSLSKALIHSSDVRIYRPLSYLSFALNWHFGRYDVFGYHLVNIFIHCLSAGILFLTIMALFKTPALLGRFAGCESFIALLAATLWAVNPIQTQAVTYIVQRMTLLASLFYLLSVYCYLKARLQPFSRPKIFFFLACFLSFVLGVASKENALMLPMALLLVEIVFFQDMADPRVRRFFVGAIAAGGVLVLVLGFALFLREDPLAIFNGYNNRFFTLAQRLMTQPRVLIFYLSQIFYPAPTRLCLEHDFIVSTSLVTPWTTLPAALLVIALIAAGILRIRKNPVLSFAVLFFFLNHLIEASVIPLELVFEHRNYMPSLFLFLPVAVGIKWLFDHYRVKSRPFYHVLITFVMMLLIGLGSGSYVRNRVWETEYSLWTDANRKAPGFNRPVHNLAWTHYERIGRYDLAIWLYRKAATLKVQRRSHRAMPFNNIGMIYYRLGDYKAAVHNLQKARKMYPGSETIRFHLALAFDRQQKWEQSLRLLNPLLQKHPKNFEYQNLKGTILLQTGKPTEALAIFKKCLKLYPGRSDPALNAGVALAAIGAYPRAEHLLKYARSKDADNPFILLRLIDVNLITGDNREAKKYLRILLKNNSIVAINSALKVYARQPYTETGPNSALERWMRLNLQEATEKLFVAESS